MTQIPLSRSKGQRSRSADRFGWMFKSPQLILTPTVYMPPPRVTTCTGRGHILWRPPAQLVHSKFFSARCYAQRDTSRRPVSVRLSVIIILVLNRKGNRNHRTFSRSGSPIAFVFEPKRLYKTAREPISGELNAPR